MTKSNQSEKELIVIGPLTINQESYEVTLDGEKIDLTFKEYELLKYLAVKPGGYFQGNHYYIAYGNMITMEAQELLMSILEDLEAKSII